MDAAVFAFYLKAALMTNETIEKKGNVSLVRQDFSGAR